MSQSAALATHSMAALEKPWIEHFEVSFDDYSGFVSTATTAATLIREYEVATTSAFVITKQTKGFGDGCLKRKNHRIFWKDTQDVSGVMLEYDGVPYIILGTKVLECRHGPDRNKAMKARKLEDKEISEDTKRQREYASKCLRNDLENDVVTLGQDHRIYLSVPMPDDHENHVVGEVI
ncbi:hypothetical protein OS493_024067 [Desmophyllum pertusum]|uniref:Uncharacterized protein n=1 Tax=Desmophyllum pertusum TaxID=174260 RepID=A0A9W9ZNH5_9CNID|nr:hypothetical protein OS493_024067 [Desmophyllum pertusum]